MSVTRSRVAWTAEEDAVLRAVATERLTTREAADRLGRSLNAVYSRMKSAGISEPKKLPRIRPVAEVGPLHDNWPHRHRLMMRKGSERLAERFLQSLAVSAAGAQPSRTNP